MMGGIMMGFVHVYTGNGKGKTTAAFGQALRAACAGMNVFIGQFIKGMKYTELDVERYIPNITIEQFGRDCFIKRNPDKIDIELAQKGFEKVKNFILNGTYDLVILDELNVAIYYGLIPVSQVLELLEKRDKDVEIIITGRYAPNELLEYADLVTQMREVKHYYTKGIMARKGIEF